MAFEDGSQVKKGRHARLTRHEGRRRTPGKDGAEGAVGVVESHDRERLQTISSTGKASSDSVLAHRLRKRARYLDRWAVREKLTAYRVFDRDIPGYHFTVDRYADWLLVSEYPWGDREESVHAARRGELEKLLPEILGVPNSRTCWCTRKRPTRWGPNSVRGGRCRA